MGRGRGFPGFYPPPFYAPPPFYGYAPRGRGFKNKNKTFAPY